MAEQVQEGEEIVEEAGEHSSEWEATQTVEPDEVLVEGTSQEARGHQRYRKSYLLVLLVGSPLVGDSFQIFLKQDPLRE